jgi:hypothetical protein
MVIYSGFSHEKWWFSIAMLVYQRVIHYVLNHGFLIFLGLFLILWYIIRCTCPSDNFWIGLGGTFPRAPSMPRARTGEHPFRLWREAHLPCSCLLTSCLWEEVLDHCNWSTSPGRVFTVPFSFESMFNIANLPKLCPEKQSNIIQLYNIDTKPSKIIWNHLKHVKSSKTN